MPVPALEDPPLKEAGFLQVTLELGFPVSSQGDGDIISAAMRDFFQSLGRRVTRESKDQRDTIASSAKRFINTENPAQPKKKKKKDMKGEKSQIQQSQQSEKDY